MTLYHCKRRLVGLNSLLHLLYVLDDEYKVFICPRENLKEKDPQSHCSLLIAVCIYQQLLLYSSDCESYLIYEFHRTLSNCIDF